MIQLTHLLVFFWIFWMTSPAWVGAGTTQTLTVQDILALPVTRGDFRVHYGSGPLQFGDLRLPEGDGPFPVVVFVHGGCWLSRYNLDHVSAANEALRKRGFATWSLEYRRVGDPGGGWPGTFLDVAAGTDFLRSLAEAYPLDLRRVVAVGHSAGGHLALWLVSRKKLPSESVLFSPDPLPLSGVVSLAGVPDLESAFNEKTCGDAVGRLMGGTPEEESGRYAQASPRRLLPLGVRQRLLGGALDGIVPKGLGESYVRAAREAGDEVELTVFEKAGHFELISPNGAEWGQVEEVVASLIERIE